MTKATRWSLIGNVFQYTMLVALIAPLVIFSREPLPLIFWLLFYAGATVFVWCLWRLYKRRARLQELITSGPFFHTRHPMYWSLLLMNVCVWAPHNSVWVSPLFLGLEAVFIICMVLAAYCQEQETLERFGQQARLYYDRTPRIPFSRW